MKCIELQESGKFLLKEVPIPKPKSGELLVRVMAAPINPSDLVFLEGKYASEKKTPCIMGFEGCGIVVETGGGFSTWGYKNKKVGFSTTNGY